MTPNTVEPPIVKKTEPRVTKKKRRIWPWILLLAIAGAATYLYPRVTQFAPQQPAKKGGKGGEGGRAVPVVAAGDRYRHHEEAVSPKESSLGKQLFGTDGIRGVAGEYPLDPATVFAFGVALGEGARPAQGSRPAEGRTGLATLCR